MKKLLIICCLYAALPLSLLSQSSKKAKGHSIYAATTFNFYPPFKPYKFISNYQLTFNDLILKYLTPRSGTFAITEGDTIQVERIKTSKLPSQLVGVGASVQFKAQSGLFHEISLTKLTFNKSSHVVSYIDTDITGKYILSQLGYEESSAAFALRYELGKYFGKRKNAKFRFGLSGGIEPTFYAFKRTSLSSREYPMRARLFTIEVSVVPVFAVALSKKLSLDFKIIPNILMADFGKVTEENPSLPISQQAGERKYTSPDINLAFSLLLRYNIKEAKKKRGE